MKRNVSNKMKLVLFILTVPYISAHVSLPYDGFEVCDVNGWQCPFGTSWNIFDFGELTLDCSKRHKDARVWIWSARFPTGITSFTVKNCNHVELHVDCTYGSRTNHITEFKAININRLDILQTSERNVHLHDNSPIPHLPKKFHLINIGRADFYSGLFRGPHPSCNNDLSPVKNVILENVTLNYIARDAFANTTATSLEFRNVTVKHVEKESIVFNGNVKIYNAYFNTLPMDALNITGDEVDFSGNTLVSLSRGAINVISHNFTFKNNKIHEIMSKGLLVKSSHINFIGNVIGLLSGNSLSGLSPFFYKKEVGYKLTYKFVANEFLSLAPFSLHCNWEAYERSCSELIIDGNKFDCSCYNLIWMRDAIKDNADKNYGFYKMLLNTTHHCGSTANCRLSSILHKVCDNTTDIEKECKGFKVNETMSSLDVPMPSPDDSNNSNLEILGENPDEQPDAIDENVNLEKSLPEMDIEKRIYDQEIHSEKSTSSAAPTWIPLLLTFSVILTLASLATIIWYLKKRKNHNIVQAYKYNKRNDSDSLIVNPTREESNAEYENPSFSG